MSFTGISWYVSPSGSPSGNGSPLRPWDLATAFRHPEGVEPGDVIWLAGGVYRADARLECRLRGTEEAPIEVWGDPKDGAAVIEFGDARPYGLHITGQYATYGDFALRCASNARWSDEPESTGDPRGTGILCEAGPGTRLVRLRVSDFGTSLFESQPNGVEIVGCVFSNAYWDAPDRSHGPGLYVRNPRGAPRKRIVDNVVFQHGRQGLQGFGSTPFSDVDVVGNIFFNNGIARDGFHRNFMFGNDSDAHDNVLFEDNTTYFPAGPVLGHEYNLAGGDGGSHGLKLRGNWLAHEGRPALRVNRAAGVEIAGNRFIGATEYTSFDESLRVEGQGFENLFPNNAYWRNGARPNGAWIRVRFLDGLPSHWHRKGLAYVAILNWDDSASVEVDFSQHPGAEVIPPDADLTIRCFQAWDEAIVLPYGQGKVAIPMGGHRPSWPIGRDPDEPLPPTLPKFGAFSLLWSVAGDAWKREPTRIPDPGKGQPREAARQNRWAAWRTNTAEQRAALLAVRVAQWRAQTAGRVL